MVEEPAEETEKGQSDKERIRESHATKTQSKEYRVVINSIKSWKKNVKKVKD